MPVHSIRQGLSRPRRQIDQNYQSALIRQGLRDGRANRAIGQALARALGVAPSAVGLLQGGGSRQKVFRIAGDPAELVPKLEKLIA